MTLAIATMTPVIYKFGIWTLGTVGIIDLIAASTNSFNGALLARRPDHYRHFTIIGVILLAYAGGIGGGVLRDVLVNKVPSQLVNPWYLIFGLAAAILALVIEFNSGQKFKDGLFQFMTAFTLPWYAIVGAQVAVAAHLGYMAAVLIGVIATTGGRFIIDIACNVIPKQLVRGEYFVLTAAATAALYLVLNGALGLSIIVSTILAFFFGFGFRLLSQYFGWEEWEPWEPPELKAGEKARKTLGEGLHLEFKPDANATKEP
jgi:uncharacterized membrane protein YeiH